MSGVTGSASAKFTNGGCPSSTQLGLPFGGTKQLRSFRARIFHSTTVTGVRNTWGYGAHGPNSYNDIPQWPKTIIDHGAIRRRRIPVVACSKSL